MSAAAAPSWRPVYDASETIDQYAARQRQAFAAFELAWREGRVASSSRGTTTNSCAMWGPMPTPGGPKTGGARRSG